MFENVHHHYLWLGRTIVYDLIYAGNPIQLFNRLRPSFENLGRLLFFLIVFEEAGGTIVLEINE